MLVYLIRRLGQSLLVVAVMATLVFVAMFAVGDPVDILASPDADQVERDAIASASGSTGRSASSSGCSSGGALHGDLGRSFVYNMPAVEADPAAPAGDARARARRRSSSRSCIGIPLGLVAGLKPDSAAGRSIMSGSILGFSLPNFWIGLMLILLFAVELRMAAGRRARADRPPCSACRRDLPTLDGLQAPDPAGADPRALQVGARDPHRPGRHARGDAAGLRPLRARQGPHAVAHHRRARPARTS